MTGVKFGRGLIEKDILYVTTATLLDFYDDGHHGFLMIVSFLIVADWSIRHGLKVKVSSNLLRTVLL